MPPPRIELGSQDVSKGSPGNLDFRCRNLVFYPLYYGGVSYRIVWLFKKLFLGEKELEMFFVIFEGVGKGFWLLVDYFNYGVGVDALSDLFFYLVSWFEGGQG